MAPTGAGPLSGLTFAVKDLIDVAGTPTGGGNPDWLKAQGPAARSAPAVEALLAAGATLNGKTITDELAFGLEGVNVHYGTPVNPVCPDRIPGGSSSGSGVSSPPVWSTLPWVPIPAVRFACPRVLSAYSASGQRTARFCRGRRAVLAVLRHCRLVRARHQDALSLAGDALLPKADIVPKFASFGLSATRSRLPTGVSAMLRSRCAELEILDEITLFDGAPDEWLECYRVVQCAGIWQTLGPWIRSAQPRFGDAIAARFAEASMITPAETAR